MTLIYSEANVGVPICEELNTFFFFPRGVDQHLQYQDISNLSIPPASAGASWLPATDLCPCDSRRWQRPVHGQKKTSSAVVLQGWQLRTEGGCLNRIVWVCNDAHVSQWELAEESIGIVKIPLPISVESLIATQDRNQHQICSNISVRIISQNEQESYIISNSERCHFLLFSPVS